MIKNKKMLKVLVVVMAVSLVSINISACGISSYNTIREEYDYKLRKEYENQKNALEKRIEELQSEKDDIQSTAGSSETTTTAAVAETFETASNFPDEDAFIRAVLKCINNKDYEKYYDDYYSKTLRVHFTLDKYTWLSQIRTQAKNYNMRNFQIVDKLYSKKVNNLWIYIISNDYTDESGRDQYAEAFFWVFIEDGNWVCCPEEDGNTYYDELVENGTFKLIDGEDNETIPEDLSNTSSGNTYSQNNSNKMICPTCNGTGQMYNPNLYYDAGMNMWQGGYVACSGCGGSGYIN